MGEPARKDDNRTEKGLWLPGRSGNPGGRPKDVHNLAKLARTHTTEALTTIIEVMRSEKATPGTKLKAASAILDRGWGRPSQNVDVNVQGQVQSLSTVELLAIVNRSPIVDAVREEQEALAKRQARVDANNRRDKLAEARDEQQITGKLWRSLDDGKPKPDEGKR